ncbi:MAG: hypothetical protein JWQ98_1462, partial [Chlorobi bacterium]|nr:hypothetical protein [Chlorobiota bacterium]
MRRLSLLLLSTFLLLAVSVQCSYGQALQYAFTVGSGSIASNAGEIRLISSYAGIRGYQNVFSFGIGFPFVFDGVTYTTCWANTSGLMGLGTNYPLSTGYNQLANYYSSLYYPLLACYWDDLYITGGAQSRNCTSRPYLSYNLTGTAPNRVLSVTWTKFELYSRSGNYSTFQTRLYETSNRIEYFYSEMRTTSDCNLGRGVGNMSATIGLAASPSRFVSVSLASGSPVASTVSVDNNVNILATRINSGDLYTFTPCSLQLTGRTGAGNGAPATQVNNGDLFFTNFSTQVGNQTIYSPLSIKMTDPSCIRNYTLSISGPAASEYYFNNTPGTQVINGSLSNGQVDNPTITFRPTGTGVRTATLLISDAAGFSRTVTLNAQAPFVNYTGNIAQGAQSVAMNSGDTLFNQTAVNRFTFQDFQPFTLTNVSSGVAAISYSITGPGAAQYTFPILPASSLAVGASTTPTIRFSPVTFGRVPATLQVTAAGQTRTFPLNGISAAPGGTLMINSVLLDSNTILFNNQYSCVGGTPTSYPVTFTNVGYGPFTITGVEAYATDTTYGQGTPKYLNRRDAQGRLVPIADYFISDQQSGTVPVYPIVVGQGQTRTIYLNFIGQQPSKRFAQLYIRTNGQNFLGRDTNGVMTEGIINFAVYARGQGAQLSDNAKGGLPNTITFPSTKVGEVSKKAVTITNPGQCDLRISLSSLQVISGDAKEFIISKMPTAGIDPVTNDLIIPAGGSNNSIEISFAPLTGGARRAALVLRTNDSTVILPGHTLRGVYYLDLFGTSPMSLTASNLDLGSALIGGGTADQKRGVVYLENTASNPIRITQVLIDGADTADFKMDGLNAWPTLPKDLFPGERLDLGIVFAPGSGTPGPRTVKVRLVLSSGDTVDAIVTGVSGTRDLAVSTTTLNFDTKAGKFNRQTVTITNIGTLPVTLTKPIISGATASDFTLGTLPRLVLNAGQTEYLEVTYSPIVAGTATSTLTIGSDATSGLKVVALSGTGTSARFGGDNPTQGTRGGHEDVTIGGNVDLNAVSGVSGEVVAGGVALRQS